jgi:hypothetical protein
MVKRVVPDMLRRGVRQAQRRYAFERAITQFRRDPEVGSRDQRLLDRLRFGWGNEGWSAGTDFLSAALALCLRPNQSILECGSGLSTLLMAIAAEGNGSTLISLEDSSLWAAKVARLLKRHTDGKSVTLCHASLANYGDYCWYTVPEAVIQSRNFSIVVCDGPSGDTLGGRYGLVPRMRQQLLPNCVILLDDFDRTEEQHIADRWKREFGLEWETAGDEKTYARIVVPPGPPTRREG